MTQAKTFKSMLLLSILILIQNVTSSPRVDPLVNTNVGLIQGLTASDGDYSMFLGIPYASVNSSNPFGPAISHSGFNETFEAFDDSIVCPQADFFSGSEPLGSLDCLRLNIYVPNSASSSNLQNVLVYIHGGAFAGGLSGRSRFGPQFLIQHDIILVTLNYRLGVYGFMCVDHPEVSGNQGLKDQHLALRWIKNNIEAFGGNPNEITISGESAGSASVDLHLLYSDDGLFDKAILLSGTSLGHWAVPEPDRSAAVQLANLLGFSSESTRDAIAFLSTVDTSLVIGAASESRIMFRPCVEDSFDGVTAFIGTHPINTRQPRVRNTPVLVGYNDDEALSRSAFLEVQSNEINTQFQEVFDFEAEYLQEMEDIVRHFYFGDRDVVESNRPYIDFASDFEFGHPTVRSIYKYLDNDATAIYHYIFSYVGGRNIEKNSQNITEGGAAHSDELGYLFHQAGSDAPTPEDQVIIDRITTLWTNFVKYGNPTPVTTDLLPVIWSPITDRNDFYYLSIDKELTVETRFNHERMAFWDLFYQMNAEYIRATQLYK